MPVPEGGTGLVTVTAHDLMIGAGTSAIALIAPNATVNVPFVSKGAAADPDYSLTTVIDTITTSSTGTTTLNVSADATNNSVNIGTGGGNKVVTIGSLTGSSGTTIYGGSANLTLQVASSKVVNISTDDNIADINIGYLFGGTQKKFTTIGCTVSGSSTTIYGYTGLLSFPITVNGPTILCSSLSTAALDIFASGGGLNIDDDANNNTVKVGTGSAIKTCTFGSVNSSSATTLQSGSGALNITATGGALTMNSGTGALSISNDASATTVNLATGGAAKTVTLGSTTGTSSLALKYGTNDFTLASATGTTMAITHGGSMTKPLQPAFRAYLSANVNNVTGDGTVYTLICNTVLFDQQSNYNNSTGIFTAPVTGKYSFNCTAWFQGMASNNNMAYIEIEASSDSSLIAVFNPYATIGVGQGACFWYMYIVDDSS